MVTPLQTLGNWFTGGKKPRPSSAPPIKHVKQARMSGYSHTYDLEKTRSGPVSPDNRESIDCVTLTDSMQGVNSYLQAGHHVRVHQSAHLPNTPGSRFKHEFDAAYTGPTGTKEHNAFNRISDRRNGGAPYTYSLGTASVAGDSPKPAKASIVESPAPKTTISSSTASPAPKLVVPPSPHSIQSWRTGVSRSVPPPAHPKPGVISTPAFLAEELDIQSRRTAAVPAPCHVTIFPHGPDKAQSSKLKPPTITMRTATGQAAGPVPAQGAGGGGAGFPPFPPFPPFPAFPAFPSFPAWPTFPQDQAHGR
jgi:hypothetical protein